MASDDIYDVIIVGSGAAGGWLHTNYARPASAS